jgi:hypothetical protein
MLERAFNLHGHWGKWPTYVGCSASENFKDYQFFAKWCNMQKGFNLRDENGKVWQLDKDLLVPGNKVYSEDTCVFLPPKLNYILLDCGKARGILPVGVYFEKRSGSGKFKAQISENGKRINLGRYNTAEDAFDVYRSAKIEYVKRIAEQYKDDLDSRAYSALCSYEPHD